MKNQVKALHSGNLLGRVVKHRSVYLLLFLPLLHFIVFQYLPIWNAQIAFREFMPNLGVPDAFLDEIGIESGKGRGVFGSAWAGVHHFYNFITSHYFFQLMRNTLGYSFAKLFLGLPIAILLAVAVFESTRRGLAKAVQTLSYLPHFLSWVIMLGILRVLLNPSGGIINDIRVALGADPVAFLTDTRTFPWVVIISEIWHSMGWSAIIFIAALVGIDPTLYEAATVEGASAWKKTLYITLPSIRPVIVIVLLLRLGTILNAGFLQIFMLYSLPVLDVADIIDTWVYRQGLLNFQYSLATAVGLFKGVIALGLILVSNWFVKKFDDSSIF
ncbi:MAG: ABC transporter permease subunit [Treponema sp.]|jgi:putative aldouronate transport system permease protein|nr:ABC transporter permease subunit [Treponema sp.]